MIASVYGEHFMRDIQEVVREKESQLSKINEELAALRLVIRLLEDTSDQTSGNNGQKIPPQRDEMPKASAGRLKNFP
jgi:hypothetical protein